MKVGLITFHGSYNHGSMLQSYAALRTVEKLGHDCEIINFRMKSQKEYYALYQTKYGAMRFFRGILLLPFHCARKERMGKFEEFFSSFFKLSGRELETYDDLKEVSDTYDVYMSGSDQIWSNLIPEFVGSKTDYTGVYFLDFVRKGIKKISFSPSVGEVSFESLEKKKSLLIEYSSISTREEEGLQMLEAITGKHVEPLLDPTFMLTGDEWREIETKEPPVKGKYIFLYTLRGIRPGLKWARHLKKLGKRLGLRVVSVSPFFPVIGITNLINVGPKDFLSLIDNAELVFTDSFHGTAFSINLNKPFYSFNKSGGRDARKVGVMAKLGLSDRGLTSFEAIDGICDYSLDYSMVNVRLNEARLTGLDWLKNSIEN